MPDSSGMPRPEGVPRPEGMPHPEGSAGIEQFRRVLATRLGLAFDAKRDGQLAELLTRRATQHGLTERGYLDRLATAWHSELAAVAEAVAVSETYFFRNIEQFTALAQVVLPERLRARRGGLRLLSVGCSTGEEAYTLAMVAAERVPAGRDVSILGIDVNRGALRAAAAGRYSSWSLRETPEAERQRWFHVAGHGVEIDERLRRRVRFVWHNLTDDDPVLFAADTYDVVCCRNVLMYLTPEVSAAVLERITRALAPGGYLFLGHTDSLGSRPAGLSVEHTHGTFYYRKALRTQPPPRPAAPADTRRAEALLLVQQDRYEDALRLLDSVTGPAADRAELLVVHAAVLAHLGRTGQAAALCRRVLDRDVLNADAHHLLGDCREGDGEHDAAVEQHHMAARLDAGFAMPRLRLGLLARRSGDRRTAGEQLDRAVTLLRHESDERILLFGGGFSRSALITLCRAELAASR